MKKMQGMHLHDADKCRAGTVKRHAVDDRPKMKNMAPQRVTGDRSYIWPCSRCWACISWLGAAIVIPGPESGPPIDRFIPPVDMLLTFERLLGR